MTLLMPPGQAGEPEADDRKAYFMAHLSDTYDQALANGMEPTFLALVIGQLDGPAGSALALYGTGTETGAAALGYASACMARTFNNGTS